MPTAEAFSIRPRCRRDHLWSTARAEGRPPSTLCSCTPISRPSFWASSTIVACSSWRRKRRCSYRRQPACSTRLRSTTMYVRRPVHVDIHSTSAGRTPVFYCYNIHSVAYKLDDSLEVRHVLSINALFLVETWYDGDLFSFLRFLLDGFQVVDCPRPRTRTATLATKYGGVAAMAVLGVRLCKIDVGIKAATFQLLCTSFLGFLRLRCDRRLLHWIHFITPLHWALLRTRLRTIYVDPVYLVGDFSIRIDRPADRSTRQFTKLLTAHGLACYARHRRMTIVCLTMGGAASQPSSHLRNCTRRSWRQFDVDAFHARLSASTLCWPEAWAEVDVDGLVQQ